MRLVLEKNNKQNKFKLILYIRFLILLAVTLYSKFFSNLINHFLDNLRNVIQIFISKRNFINYWCRYNRNARKKGMEYVRMYYVISM